MLFFLISVLDFAEIFGRKIYANIGFWEFFVRILFFFGIKILRWPIVWNNGNMFIEF